jgi:hypothetical protein
MDQSSRVELTERGDDSNGNPQPERYFHWWAKQAIQHLPTWVMHPERRSSLVLH